MHYTSTLENLECLWNPLSMCSTHRVGAFAILYPLVKVSTTENCSCKHAFRIHGLHGTQQVALVHSQSIIKDAIKMDYTSTLETLEDFSMSLSWCSEHQVGAWAILYPLVKVNSPGNSSLWSTRCIVRSLSIITHAI